MKDFKCSVDNLLDKQRELIQVLVRKVVSTVDQKGNDELTTDNIADKRLEATWTDIKNRV